MGLLPPANGFERIGLGYAVISKSVSPSCRIALALLVAGGLGNLIDRLRYGNVVDFMNIGVGTLRSGISNVADIAVVFGVILLAAMGIIERSAPPVRPSL